MENETNQEDTTQAQETINKPLDEQNKEQEQNNSIFSKEVSDFLNDIFSKLNLTKEQTEIFVSEATNFQKEIIAKEQLEEKAIHKNIMDRMQQYWGEDFKKNITFASRGMKWLELKDLNSKEPTESIGFMNKMVDLGKFLSEDTNIGEGKEVFSPSKTEAIKMRNELTNNKNFNEVMSNKSHTSRKEMLDKLNYFNSIIAGNK